MYGRQQIDVSLSHLSLSFSLSQSIKTYLWGRIKKNYVLDDINNFAVIPSWCPHLPIFLVWLWKAKACLRLSIWHMSRHRAVA